MISALKTHRVPAHSAPQPQGFGSAFFADPDPSKNLHADPGEGAGSQGKNEFFFSFFHVSDDS